MMGHVYRLRAVATRENVIHRTCSEVRAASRTESLMPSEWPSRGATVPDVQRGREHAASTFQHVCCVPARAAAACRVCVRARA